MTSPEFNLLLSCCSRNFVSGGSPVCIPPQLDWPLFGRLARFHRVAGLAWHGLAEQSPEIPAEVRDDLSARAARVAADNLRSALESADLQRRFAEAGVDLLFVKGLTLGQLAYARIGTKAAIDIDLLVRPSDLVAAGRILESAGYALRGPTAPAAIEGLPAWHRHGKESNFLRPSDGMHVDLHSRLSDQTLLIPDVGERSPRQLVEVAPGIALPTLRDDALFAYLCVHGSSSAWFRLKWITDFAALADRWNERIPALYEQSQAYGAGRAAGQALLLADRLYATLGEHPDLRRRLLSDRPSRLLAAAALRQLAGRSEPQEPTQARFGTAIIHWTQLLMMPGAAFPFREAARQVRSALRKR